MRLGLFAFGNVMADGRDTHDAVLRRADRERKSVPATTPEANTPNWLFARWVEAYGSDTATPTIDSLAESGVMFTRYYTQPLCGPTRASLLTGLYPHQAGIGAMMTNRGLAGYEGDLNDSCVTIAQVLKAAGYATYMAGKWHVTPCPSPSPDCNKKNWPLQRGFDRFYGTIHGANSFFDPVTLVCDNDFISAYADPHYRPDTYYYTDAISDHATRYIREHSGDAPFFMYVAYTAAHWPMHALQKDIAKYRGKYDAGYGPIRQRRVEQMQKAGLISPKWKVSPQAGDWEAFPHKEFDARCMEVYAAMIDNMDQGIGRILAELGKEPGRLENTLVMYLQDNGGCAEGMGRRAGTKYPGGKLADLERRGPMKPAELQTQMIPPITRAGVPVKMGFDVLTGGPDTYHGYGRSWANVSNTPFREYKHWVHEGGIATPLIVHWPRGIKRESHGGFFREPAHLIDIMATCVDVSGSEYPTSLADQNIVPMEGTSLWAAIQGKSLNRQTPLFFEHEGNRAIRNGKWKLVAKGARGTWELYDMAADRTELNDLADVHPQRVKEMSEQWEAWARRAHVKPWPYDKRNR